MLKDTDRRLNPPHRPAGYNRLWTAEEDAILVKYWKQRPCRWIGDRMLIELGSPRTKNSVIGRAHILGLSDPKPPAPPPEPPKPPVILPTLEVITRYAAGLCAKCPSPHQPGRYLCAGCIETPLRKRPWTGMSGASGASSLW